MLSLSLIPKHVLGSVEPAVRSVADRLFILTGGRQGSLRNKPTIESFFETGLVVKLFEFLLMNPEFAHLEIRHEMPFPATTRPSQVDLWIRSPNGGRAVFLEAGDFTPGKVKTDASKMRRLNPRGTNWFLAFFRDNNAREPWKKLKECRGRKGSLKGCHLGLDEHLTRSFSIRLPNQAEVWFGYSLIRVR